MATFRIVKSRGFTTIPNALINDSEISFKAKGILIYLLSKPDDWKVYESDIVNHSTDGRDKVRSGIKELLDAGYISRAQTRNESGQFEGIDYEVREERQTLIPARVEPVAGKSVVGESVNGKSNTTNTNLTKTDLTKTKKRTEGENPLYCPDCHGSGTRTDFTTNRTTPCPSCQRQTESDDPDARWKTKGAGREIANALAQGL